MRRYCLIGLLVLVMGAGQPLSGYAEGFFSKFLFFGRGGESLSDRERTTKDLMRAAIDHAVYEVSQVNGFYHAPELKIEIPETVQKLEKISRKLNTQIFWHEFELGINRAAEKAATKAGVLMKSALEDLKFEKDPERILMEEGSLTEYFKRKMEPRLYEDFRREVERSISNEAALAPYVEMKNLYTSLPFVKNPERVFQLEDEVSRRALNGLFMRVTKEEARLRTVRS